MSDVWELAAYVEDHPGDHQQRWRLAKKLYAEREYLLALENLQVLNKEWTPKLNVQRYLAATYYRLGRYTEAQEHLLKTIEQWPDEVGPCEQLAHIYEVDERPKDALKAWSRVLSIQPDHVGAKEAVKKLEQEVGQTEQKKNVPVGGIMQPGLTLGSDEDLPITGLICPQCGARNSDEFETCWQCNANLRKQSPSFMNAAPLEAHGPYLLRPETMTTLALVVIGLLLAASLALGIHLVLSYKNSGDPPFSIEEVWNRVMVPARLAAGIVMLLFWPVALKLALRLFRIKSLPPEIVVYISGLLLGALVLLLLLLPMPFIFFAFAGSMLLSLFIVVFTFKTDVRLAPAVWITQFVLVWVIGFASFWMVECRRHGEWINPLVELPAVRTAYNNLPVAHPVKLIASATTPMRQKVRWRSSGSTWLDVQAEMTAFTVHPQESVPDMRFQIYQGSDLKYHEELQSRQGRTIYYPIIPGKEYEIVIQAAEPIVVHASIQSLLPFEFLK